MSSNRKSKKIPIEDRLREEFNLFISLEKSKLLNISSFDLLKTKVLGHDPLRARYADVMYQHLKTCRVSFLSILKNAFQRRSLKKFFQYKLPFILEVIISIQYYHNQILDGKKGFERELTDDDKLIFSSLLREQLYRYLDTIRIGHRKRQS